MAHLWPKSLDTQMLENQKCEHAAFSKKEYVVYLGIDRLWEGCKLSPGWFGANFPSVKILDFRGAKVFARFVAKRVPKCWEPRKMRLQLGEMVQIFSTEIVQPGWCINHQQKDEKYSARENCK